MKVITIDGKEYTMGKVGDIAAVGNHVSLGGEVIFTADSHYTAQEVVLAAQRSIRAGLDEVHIENIPGVKTLV